VYKNDTIFQNLLNERKLKRAKMLHKALLHHKVKTAAELQDERREQLSKEYFYVQKKKNFLKMNIFKSIEIDKNNMKQNL